ncbi:MAG TPA: DMT family transporter [Devosiaceae bacterium]|jgi:drug/metabolite transporter (DMT)-like permease|nr:DMT family transporter [Devosiaceae bacterium]
MESLPARPVAPVPIVSRQRLLAHLAMLLFAALVGGSFTFGAMAVPFLAPAPLNAVRFILAAVLMGAFAFGVSRQRFAWPAAPWRFAVMGFLMAIYFVTMFVALQITLPVATSAVFTLIPLMTAGIALFLVKQRSGPLVLLSLLLAGLGSIWVIFRGDVEAILAFDIGRGELIFFFGCLAYAIYTPLLRRFSHGEPATVLSFWTLVGSAICITAWALPEMFSTDWTALPPLVWWVILYLAVGSTAICFFLIQFAARHLPAAKVIAYGYLTPAFVIVLEGLAGHGWTSLSVATGAAVTILGLVVLAALPDK